MRSFAKTPEDVRKSGRAWVECIQHKPEIARSVIRRTRYWVEDPAFGDFYPSKWVGFAGMTERRYAAAQRGAEEGAWFNGTAARQAVEAALADVFRGADDGGAVHQRLVTWTTARLSDVLDGINQAKWSFVTMVDAKPDVTRSDVGDGFWSRYRESWGFYEHTWETYNEVLYEMCAARPGHDSMKDVVAKVGIVARAYAAGLERHGDPDGPGAIVGVSRTLQQAAPTVDKLMEELQKVAGKDDALVAGNLAHIVRIHGEFQRLTSDATRSAVRSWVSKYLHFHAPGVPLYDSRACRMLQARYDLRRSCNRHFAMPQAADKKYWGFCNRFLSMWREGASLGLPVTVRRLDQFLLYLADAE